MRRQLGTAGAVQRLRHQRDKRIPCQIAQVSDAEHLLVDSDYIKVSSRMDLFTTSYCRGRKVNDDMRIGSIQLDLLLSDRNSKHRVHMPTSEGNGLDTSSPGGSRCQVPLDRQQGHSKPESNLCSFSRDKQPVDK